MTVKVQQNDFNVGHEIQNLRLTHKESGAIVSFVGQVRDLNEGNNINSLTLTHYSGMTEKSIEKIIVEAKKRWDITDTLVIHRIGKLYPLDQIVLVVVTSAHRGEAFSACEYIMDYLKTEAPFWKKETTPTKEYWVEAKNTDEDAKKSWDRSTSQQL